MRTIAKTVMYRGIVSILLVAITYYFTGNPGSTTVIAVAFNVGATVIYYFFERFWAGVRWGKLPVVDGFLGQPQVHPIGVRRPDHPGRQARET